MEAFGRGVRIVGDYMLDELVGSGSFSNVWHARHRIHGKEVAVKEINMDKLNKKLCDNLMSEIATLHMIDHPNIIALLDVVEVPGRTFLILEYCRGGDLSSFIERHKHIPEATVKNFMRQLASGLQVLREHYIIHRDLKPQNLLLSRSDELAVLKIADFGFARPLQPFDLADSLCGSPLYMAPEIMMLKKYDAKADLWSVGVILYQMVTRRTPFTGTDQRQLLHNIASSSRLHFPRDNELSIDCIDLCIRLLHRHSVERLSFEEFFSHPFLLHNQKGESLRTLDESPLNLQNNSTDSSFSDFSVQPDARTSVPVKKSPARPTYGFPLDTGIYERSAGDVLSSNTCNISAHVSICKHDCESKNGYKDRGKQPSLFLEVTEPPLEEIHSNISPEDPSLMNSSELVIQEYEFVDEPLLEMPSSSLSSSRSQCSSHEFGSLPLPSKCFCIEGSPLPVIGAVRMEQSSSSSHSASRVSFLQQCASTVTELVKKKVELGELLEAFSVQLVILAIWKQSLHMCHSQSANTSPFEGSFSEDIIFDNTDIKESFVCRECVRSVSQHLDSSQIERAFLVEVENAESLVRFLVPLDDDKEMPDAMEIIFQYAIILGRNGAVDEFVGNTERAAFFYAKSIQLLCFLLVEAPLLALDPPFSLSDSDKPRLLLYVELLRDRQSQCHCRKMVRNNSTSND